MDLKQIEYILKIAEEQNITRAAEKLFITQSALNQQLLKLEKELGTPLFYRSRTNCQPTPAGEIYIETGRRIMMLKKDAYDKIYDISENQKGRLAIGFTAGRGITMFSKVYPEFHQFYPQVHIDPLELSVHDQTPLLLSGQLDIGFMTLLERQQKGGLEYLHIANENLVLAVPSVVADQLSLPAVDTSCLCSTSRQEKSFPECDLTIFKDAAFALTHKNSTIRELVDHIFIQAGFKPDVLFETSNNHAIISAVHSGICCGIIPMYYVQPQDTHIRYFSLPEHPVWNICAVHRKNHYLTKAAREFISLAAKYFQTLA